MVIMNERGTGHGERGHLSVKVYSAIGVANFWGDGAAAYETQTY